MGKSRNTANCIKKWLQLLFVRTKTLDSEENTFVYTLTGGGATWLDASDVAVEGEWRWVSGPEAGQLLTYTNWGPGEPNNSGNEDFAVYNNPWGGGFLLFHILCAVNKKAGGSITIDR